MESRILLVGLLVLVAMLLLGVYRAHFAEPAYCPVPTPTAAAAP